MLEGRNLSFRYHSGREWIFRNLNVVLAPGERVGMPGPSGRGKSTLAKVLAGYLDPAEGAVAVDGEPRRERDFNPVQLLFQHPELAVNPRWRMKDVLAEAGMPPKDMLRRLGIDDAWLGKFAHELSGGELQRICLARALDPRTRYLLCDEITSMLDALTQAAIWKTLLEVAAARNIGLLVISHDPDLLQRICSRSLGFFAES